MRRLGYLVADTVAGHLSTLRDQPAYATLDTAAAERLIERRAPAQGTDFETLLATLRDRVFPHAAREPHPGFIAYVPSCPTFPAVLGDWLATGFNFFAGVWPVAAGPNEIELVVLDWFRDWLGMPEGSSGLLTSGGSGANLTAMIAALIRERLAMHPARHLTVYSSDRCILVTSPTGSLRSAEHVRSLPSDTTFACARRLGGPSHAIALWDPAAHFVRAGTRTPAASIPARIADLASERSCGCTSTPPMAGLPC